MKLYQKPKIDCTVFIPVDSIAGLSAWLAANELSNAGITTYTVNS